MQRHDSCHLSMSSSWGSSSAAFLPPVGVRFGSLLVTGGTRFGPTLPRFPAGEAVRGWLLALSTDGELLTEAERDTDRDWGWEGSLALAPLLEVAFGTFPDPLPS